MLKRLEMIKINLVKSILGFGRNKMEKKVLKFEKVF